MRQPRESRELAKKLAKELKTHPVLVTTPSNDDDEGLNYSSSDKLKLKKMKKKMKKATEASSDKKKKKLKKKKEITEDDDSNQQQTHDDNMDVAKSHKKVKKSASNKKRKVTKKPETETTEAVDSTVSEVAYESKSSDAKRDKKTSKSKKKKRDKESKKKNSARKSISHSDNTDQQQSGTLKNTSQPDNASTLFDDEDEVYEMSSGDEDETTGMKRWITKYHRARPGAEVLMENINDFLVDYAVHKEREKKEREEEAAEGGWTVVGQHKGRKKTTEPESGTTVGSVAPAAVMDKLSKKKDKEIGHNFYRFQRREAQRNEIMTLQSKFEQDKKRIQELRAARKFRPY